MEQLQEEEEASCSFRIAHIKSLASVLQCIKSGNKQTCTMVIGQDGLTVHWEDDSKALQSSAFFKAELFADYTCPSARNEFGLQLNLLLDTLNVFATSTGPMSLSYPGPNGELNCEMLDSSYGPTISTYARISSIEQPVPRDLNDYWEDPTSFFLIPGSMLKEAVEDLEWPGGDAQVVMARDPQRLSLRAVGHGTLEIEIPTAELSGFSCAETEVRYGYKYKHLRTACCNLPHPKEAGTISTKVSIDCKGLLKVTHMISLAGGQGQRPPPQLDPAGSLMESQRLYDGARVAIVQFVLEPVEDDGGS